MTDFKARNAGRSMHKQIKDEKAFNILDELSIPENLMNWMNAVLGNDHQPCGKYSWRNFLFWLRDGVSICKLMNKLREHSNAPAIKFGPNATTKFIAIQNIEAFNNAAREYGVDASVLFQSDSLYNDGHKGPFVKVIMCLHHVALQANQKGFQPTYKAVDLPADGLAPT